MKISLAGLPFNTEQPLFAPCDIQHSTSLSFNAGLSNASLFFIDCYIFLIPFAVS
jgi:hypothetical protein